MMKRDTDRFQKDLIPPGSTVLCAVSGGADSIYLLSRLRDLQCVRPFRLAAAHFNHRLRGEESDRDEAFVREFVRTRCGPLRLCGRDGEIVLPGVELFVGSGDVSGEARRQKRGLEETARTLRYAFLRRTAAELGGALIATAHTADDNAETVLLHLARGAGLRGLAGIRPEGDGLIRPMLAITRREVEAYLRLYGLPHVEDSTNADETYARNRVRHQVIPALDGLYPGLAARLSEEISRFRADEEYLTEQAASIAAQAAPKEGGLAIPAAALALAPRPLAVRAVRQLLGRLRGGDADCAAAHLEGVVELCRGEDPSARLDLPGGVAARREYEVLILSAAGVQAPPRPMPLGMGRNRWGDWTAVCEAAVCPAKAYVSPEEFYLRPGAYVLRSRREGDALTLGPRPRRTVKRLMIDRKVPAARRALIPLLDRDGAAAALGGFGPDADHLAPPGQPALHIILTEERDT